MKLTAPVKKKLKTAEKETSFDWRVGFLKPKVSQDELQMLCRQMHTVLKAGIPIGSAVARLAETTRDKTLKEALKQIMVSLNQGKSLYVSLSRFPDIFNDFFINLVKLGETSGKLDTVFFHLAQSIELEVDTKKKIKTALRYPVLVLASTLIALLVINAFVIPAFAELFESFQGTLPLMTRILMTSSYVIINYWYIVAIIAFLLFVAIRMYLKTPAGQLLWGRWQLKIPIVGWLLHRIILARFARLYALVLRSGLTAMEGIELVGNSTGNAFMAKKIKRVSSLVARGNTIANSIAQTELFPPLVIQMITLGEDTGNIEELLDEVAEFYQREITYDLVRLSDVIEPIMLLVMAAMVLILALGVFLPMWDMASQMR